MNLITPFKPAIRNGVAALFLAGAAAAQYPATHALDWVEPSLIAPPPARTSAAMVYDPAMGAMLLYGGNTYNAQFGDTWSFSKTNGWRKLTPAISPPPLQGASLAYDPTTKTAVLFGGNLGHIGGSGTWTDSNQTWTWDGVTWTQQTPPASPPARSWNATNGMVFDAQLGKVVLFGGYGAGFIIMDDTWVWDGKSKTWTQLFPAHSPSARTATLAYDEIAKQILLFGGWSNGVAYDDTWAYDGVDWVQRKPKTSPRTRADNGLAYDPVLQSVVLFGGLAGPCEDCGEGRLNDTWLWDGQNWNEVQTSTSPEPSSGVSSRSTAAQTRCCYLAAGRVISAFRTRRGFSDKLHAQFDLGCIRRTGKMDRSSGFLRAEAFRFATSVLVLDAPKAAGQPAHWCRVRLESLWDDRARRRYGHGEMGRDLGHFLAPANGRSSKRSKH